MKKFLVECKDDNDKLILILMLVASFFLSCLPALIVIVGLKKYISDSTYNIAKALFNFELLLLLIMLSFMIPVIGWFLGLILGPVICILNIVIIILDIIAVANKSELPIPVWFEFL